MKFKLQALSSNKEDVYDVKVFEISGQVGVSCNCPANTFCKHIGALFTGKTGTIFPAELNNENEINSSVNLLQSSGLTKKYESLMAELDELKVEYKENTAAIKNKLNNLCVPTI